MNTSINERVELFVECFGDSIDTAIELFSCRGVTAVCKYDEDRLAAMASLVPILAEKDILGFYLYGVCVAKDLRGRGLFRQIMKDAETEARNRGASFTCLVPADEGLAKTYRAMEYDKEILQGEFEDKKKMMLCSDDFKLFARSDSVPCNKRMSGLLKSLDKDKFCPSDKQFCFADDMGDV